MNGSGKELLAGPRLSEQKNRQGRLGPLFEIVKKP
jgi:hypothetical protein